MTDDEVARLVSPPAFDGMGPVPETVTAASKRIAELRVKFMHRWQPGEEAPWTTRDIEELFAVTTVCTEWLREVTEARDNITRAAEEGGTR